MTARRKTDETPAEEATAPTAAPEATEYSKVRAEAVEAIGEDAVAAIEKAANEGAAQARAEEDGEPLVATLEEFPPDVAFSRALLDLLESGGVDPLVVINVEVVATSRVIGTPLEVRVRYYDHHGTTVGKVLTAPRLRDVAGEALLERVGLLGGEPIDGDDE